MSVRTFCDVCKKELTRNVVTERLRGFGYSFEAEVIVSKNGEEGDGDLCLDCLLKMLNRKPKRKYVRKPEQVSIPESELPTPSEIRGIAKRTRKAKKTTTSPLGKPDISTFSLTIGQGKEPHQLKMGEVAVASMTLKEGVVELLATFGIDQKFVEDAPDSEGKRNLLDMLKEKEG